MTAHHLVNESHQKEFCPYCKEDLTGFPWESKFFFELHYKAISCRCGRDLLIKVDFHGSGHDDWDGKMAWSWMLDTTKSKQPAKIRTIEDRVEVKESPGFITQGVKK